MALKEFKSTNGIANGETSQGVVTTIITSNTATTIDTVPLASFYSIDYTLTILQGTKVRTSKVLVQDDGTNVDSTEYAITETGGTISGVVVAASVSSTNMILQVTVTDAATTLVRVRAIKNVMGVIQPYLPGAPTIGTVTTGAGSATVPFTAPVDNGNTAIISYTASSTPAGVTGTASSSPITVANVPIGNTYTFSVTATNSIGTGPASDASNSVALVDSSFIARASVSPYYQFPADGLTSRFYINPTGGGIAFSDGGYSNTYSLGLIFGRLNASPPSQGWNKFYSFTGGVGPFTAAVPTAVLLDSSNNQYVFGRSSRENVGWMVKHDSAGANQFFRKIGTNVINAKWNTARTSIFMLVDGSTIVKIGTDLSTIEWQKTVSGLDGSGAMGVDESDNLYFVSRPTSGTNITVVKLNSNADLVWQKTISVGGSSVFFSAIHAVDKFGSAFVTSYTTVASTNINPFVTKIDSDGNVAWARSIYKGNSNQHFPRVTVADNIGNVFVVDDGRRPYKLNGTDGSLAYSRSFTWPANFEQLTNIGTDQNGAFYVFARNVTNSQGIFSKFAGSGSGTGTYTYGTYSAYSGVTSTTSTSTSTNASVIGDITTSSLTLTTGLPPAMGNANSTSTSGAVVYDTIS